MADFFDFDPVTGITDTCIDIYKLNDPEMDRRFTQEIEANYPALKCSDKRAWRPR